MSCKPHDKHEHEHGAQCGHTAVKHDDHVDYLHDGHLHHTHDGHTDEHQLAVGSANASTCTPDHSCTGHASEHEHSATCGHEAVPHGDHMDYIVDGHLHQPCGTHCDDHGAVSLA